MTRLIWLGVGMALGVVATRVYWNKAIGYAKAKNQEFRAWVANEFRKL
jgi:uncharacterized membrane protein YebE (DUF533 family)